MEISVVLPAYKEEENLKELLPEIKKVVDGLDAEIIVVDSLEKYDDTDLICKKNEVKYIRRTGGEMYGDAIRTGIDYATGKYTIIMDSDGSHIPQYILELYSEIVDNSFDIVIGSRYVKGGETENNRILILMSYILNVTYRLLFKLNVKDVSDSFRIYKTEQIKQINLVCDNFDVVEEILIKLCNNNKQIKIGEIPINFKKRVYGESKRDLLRFVCSYVKTIYNLKKICRK